MGDEWSPAESLLDAVSTLNEEDIGTLRLLYEAGIPALVLLSKSDLLANGDLHRTISYIEAQLKHELDVLGAGRERMLREMADALETITAETPLLVVFEDLQWADSSTIDLLSVLSRRRHQSAKLLLLGTYRPVDVLLADHPLKRLKQDLLLRRLCHEVALEPLGEAEIAEFLAAESPQASFPRGLATLLFRHSEGNPLFMVARCST